MTLRFSLADDIDAKPVIAGVRSSGATIGACDDFGMRGASDPAHLEYCAGNGLVLVTADESDFARLHRDWLIRGRTHSAVVVVRQRTSIGDQVRGLLAVHALFSEDEIRSELLYLSDWL